MKYVFKTAAALLLLALVPGPGCSPGTRDVAQQRYIQFVYSSDPHYGLYRKFRDSPIASSSVVCQALVAQINRLPAIHLPADGGVKGGEEIGYLDFVANTGDIGNRMESSVQPAAASWNGFRTDWIDGLTVRTADGRRAPLCLLPGNHDISNAIGFPEPLTPRTDPTVMIEIYNRTMQPGTYRTNATYNYTTDRVNYTFTLAGVRFAFVGLWPDSRARAWLDAALRDDSATPCLLFTHDQPDIEAKHLTNPNGDHSINATDRFENLACDTSSVASRKTTPKAEHRALASFAAAHPAIKAYFHGNSNYNEFYTWKGPDGTIALPVFRVDSPMKGQVSANDQTRLSFIVGVIDTHTHRMTVRECLWNTDGTTGTVVWHTSKTIDL